MPHFPLQEFLAYFPKFNTEDSERLIKLQSFGMRAHFHVTAYTKCVCDLQGGEFGLQGDFAKYALFLMAAHILVLNHKTDEDTAVGNASAGGSAVKAVIGSVQIENTKPNSFTVDDWSYWLNQTEYGRRLLAYLDIQAPFIYMNTRRDSVRVLK